MLTLVHDHKDWLIINKPAGVSMQKEQSEIDSLSLLQMAVSDAQKMGINITRLWPVHRLDKTTSGLVIFAKTASAAADFGELFQHQKISKTYLAIALGKPKKKQGWVKGDMVKGRNGSWLLNRSQENPAITYFNSCAITLDEQPISRLYSIRPKTGKTHQIRVALKSLGCPILGDERYKGETSDRCYLHAFQLSFDWQGIEHHYQCEPLQGSWPDLKAIPLLSEFYPN